MSETIASENHLRYWTNTLTIILSCMHGQCVLPLLLNFTELLCSSFPFTLHCSNHRFYWRGPDSTCLSLCPCAALDVFWSSIYNSLFLFFPSCVVLWEAVVSFSLKLLCDDRTSNWDSFSLPQEFLLVSVNVGWSAAGASSWRHSYHWSICSTKEWLIVSVIWAAFSEATFLPRANLFRCELLSLFNVAS